MNNIHPIVPVVVFPDGITAAEVRRRKPALFLAILSAGPGQLPLETQQAMATCLMVLFSEWIILKGEKSLDLIQALQVATLWYSPPGKLTQLNFFLLQNLAGVMAIDLGLNKQRRLHWKRPLVWMQRKLRGECVRTKSLPRRRHEGRGSPATFCQPRQSDLLYLQFEYIADVL